MFCVRFFTLLFILGLLIFTYMYILKSNGPNLIYNLNGSWNVYSSKNGSLRAIARVPEGIYSTLLRSGHLGNGPPEYADNDLRYRWVAWHGWIYECQFHLTSDDLSKDYAILHLGKIDTEAFVYVNNALVSQLSNAFIPHTLSVKPFLKTGVNSLRVGVASTAGRAVSKARCYGYPLAKSCPPLVQRGACDVSFLRTPACSFSWDWGPMFTNMGITDKIYLEVMNHPKIQHLSVEAYKNKDTGLWQIAGKLHLVPGTFDASLLVDLEIKFHRDLIVEHRGLLVQDGAVQISYVPGEQKSLKLWWPNQYGDQPLFNFTVTISKSTKNLFPSFGTYTDVKSINLAFRTIELIDKDGEFYFKVNGRSIFMKGSNWIPTTSFYENVTESKVRHLLTSAKRANINMLRVWGGGMYESDHFYSTADSLGILIWQDFMFACNLYPSDDSFIDQVQQEVLFQIRRLRHHASIALWAGNNENEWEINHYRNLTLWPNYAEDYGLLTGRLLLLTSLEDQRRPFVTSSPSNGRQSLTSVDFIASNPQDVMFGDCHTYNYTRDGWYVESRPRPRFVSEYGRQSWPYLSTYREVSPYNDLNLHSNLTQTRNHHDNGNQEILDQIKMHFILPNSSNETNYFENYIYLSQLEQAMSIKAESEFYRRSRLYRDPVTSEGHTMGALFWQLNDIWQAPSWSSIDYSGRWKPLHYFAKNFFSNALISVDITDLGKLRVFIHNENNVLLGKSLNLSVHCYHYDSDVHVTIYDDETKVTADVDVSVEHLMTLSSALESCKCANREDCLLLFKVSDNILAKEISSNFLIPNHFKHIPLFQDPHLKITNVKKLDCCSVKFDVERTSIALFVLLDIGIIGHFSDNAFMATNYTTTLKFYSEREFMQEQFKSAVSITSLYNVYH